MVTEKVPATVAVHLLKCCLIKTRLSRLRISNKKQLPLLLTGLIGCHYFYINKPLKNFLFFGSLLIFIGVFWYIYDLYRIITGTFQDEKGINITQWS